MLILIFGSTRLKALHKFKEVKAKYSKDKPSIGAENFFTKGKDEDKITIISNSEEDAVNVVTSGDECIVDIKCSIEYFQKIVTPLVKGDIVLTRFE